MCDLLSPADALFSYKWNPESCLCHYSDDIVVGDDYCWNQDYNKPLINPLDGPLCISEDEYLNIFYHTLGSDCIDGTEDDREKDLHYCPPSY